jgi:hypothetical protein
MFGHRGWRDPRYTSIEHANLRLWVPLVANRSTTARIHVKCIGGTPGPLTGTLRVFVGGQEITPLGGVGDINYPSPSNMNGQLVPPHVSDINNRKPYMLSFELSAPKGIVPYGNQLESSDVYYRVDIFSQADTRPNRNVEWTNALTVLRRGEPWLYKVSYSRTTAASALRFN